MIQEITIRPALNGYVVGVGCQHLVYTSAASLIQDLNEWLHDPRHTEDRIKKECFNKKHLLCINEAAEVQETNPSPPVPTTFLGH